MSGTGPDVESVDVNVPLPEMWTCSTLGTDELARARADLAEMLGDRVDEPAAVADDSVEEFLAKVGGGSAPIMLASFREEVEDGILAGSMIVARNELGGSLEPWRTAYPDTVDVTVDGGAALRTFEQAKVNAPDLFDEPLTLLTWRYLVPFDDRSILMFTFTSPNAELEDELLEHFDDIMAGVHVGPLDAPPADV